jgi:hypothetical protein
MTGRRITRCVAAALAVTALAAPSALARSDYPVTPTGAPAVQPVSVPGPSVVVEAEEASAFDWESAAVGAGISIALVLLAGGAAMIVVRHGRTRPTGVAR